MRLIQTVAQVGVETSGVSYAVIGLCGALGQLEHEVLLMTLAVGEPRNEPGVEHKMYDQSGFLSRLGISKTLASALNEGARDADIIHNHGLWMMPNVYSGWAAQKHKKPFVISTHGMLSPQCLKHSNLVKSVFWLALQGRPIKSACVIHATSEAEYADIRKFGLRQPVAIVPHGIDIPQTIPALAGKRERLRTVLYLGRMQSIKGLARLLGVWARIERENPIWELRLVGPDEDRHVSELMDLTHRLELQRVVFAGPKYGDEKWAEYRAADLFVMPSHSENFGFTIAEALAHGTPVIATKQTPWRGLSETGSGWWVDNDEAAIESALREAMALDRGRLAEMGDAGQSWMRRDFSWRSVAARMGEVYAWAVQGGETPSCVRTD